MSYHRLPTAPLASRHKGAGGGAVDNRQPQGSTYPHPKTVQSSGATSKAEEEAVAIVGRDVCDLPEKSLSGRFQLPLHDDDNHALEYRRIGRTKVVLLLALGAGNKTCGTILSVLQLPRYQSGEAIYFECYPRDSHFEERTPIVGLASNDGGRRRLAVARLAWQVDFISNRFVPYTKRLAICDTRGYAED